MSHTETGSSEFALRRSPRLLGKFGLRRSPRLHGKPAMKHSPIASRKSPAKGKSAMTTCKSPAKDVIDHKSRTTCTLSKFDLAKELRKAEKECRKPGSEIRLDREIAAMRFRSEYKYSDKKEKMTCIHPDGVISWEGKDSSGFTYVAFRWMCVTCVVFKRRTRKHIQDRLSPHLAHNLPMIFGLTALNDIEVLANLTHGSREGVVRGQRIVEPFAIVSVDPSSTENGSIKDEGQRAVLEYFRGLLKKDMVLGGDEIEKVAIQAFQLLYQKKFEPGHLWVRPCFLFLSFGPSLEVSLVQGLLLEDREFQSTPPENNHGECSNKPWIKLQNRDRIIHQQAAKVLWVFWLKKTHWKLSHKERALVDLKMFFVGNIS